MRKRQCFRHGRLNCTCDFRNLPRLIEPALLLLLKEQRACHGYVLADRVQEFGLSETPIEPGAVYRCLRQLEMEGHVRSEWDTSGSGPARRSYVLTRDGEALLGRWIDVIRRRSMAMVTFLNRCGDVPDQEETK